MQLTQMDTLIIRMLYLSAAGIVVLTVLGINSISSILFGMTFILVALLWGVGAIRNVTWTDAIMILTIGLSLANVITNSWIEEIPISFGYFKKYAMFICTLVYFQAAYKLRIDDKTERFLFAVNSLLALFLTLYYCFNRVAVYLMNGRVSNYLTFGFTNPNLTALFLMCIYTGELVQLYRNKSALKQLGHLFLAAALWYFIWKTASRNCLLTILFETLMCILLYLSRNGFRISKFFSLLITIWPLLFAMAYLLLIQNQVIQEIFSFMVTSGKNLDARLSVWLPAMQYYAESPIIGAYSQISNGTGMSQLHNTHLDILASYGTPILALVCYLLYNMINRSTGTNRKEETLVRICFCGTIIMGMGEAALFSGGLGIYIFAGMFLLLCNKEPQTPANEKLIYKK